MKLAGRHILEQFWAGHHRAKKPLGKWLKVVESAQWRNFADVKQTFGSADWFNKQNRDYIIFNVGGNKYRVITGVNFTGHIVVINVVITHSEYTKDKWKGRL